MDSLFNLTEMLFPSEITLDDVMVFDDGISNPSLDQLLCTRCIEDPTRIDCRCLDRPPKGHDWLDDRMGPDDETPIHEDAVEGYRFVPPSFVPRPIHTSTYGSISNQGSPFTYSSASLSSRVGENERNSSFSPTYDITNLSVEGTIDGGLLSTHSSASFFSDSAAVRPSDVSPFFNFTSVLDIISAESDTSDNCGQDDEGESNRSPSQVDPRSPSVSKPRSKYTERQQQVDAELSEDHHRSSRHSDHNQTYSSHPPVASGSLVQNQKGQEIVKTTSSKPTAKRKRSEPDDSIATVSSNAAHPRDPSTSSVPYEERLRINLPRAAKKTCLQRLGDTEVNPEEEEEKDLIIASSSRPKCIPSARHRPALHPTLDNHRNPRVRTSPKVKEYPCGRRGCGSSFGRKHDRERHWTTVHEASYRPGCYSLCGRRFSREDSVARHEDGCSLCQKRKRK